MPRAARFADRVPGPYGSRLDRFAVTAHTAHPSMHRFHPHPLAVADTMPLRATRIHEKIIVRVNLTQPSVLRIPRVIHRHWTLRDRSQRIAHGVRRLHLER